MMETQVKKAEIREAGGGQRAAAGSTVSGRGACLSREVPRFWSGKLGRLWTDGRRVALRQVVPQKLEAPATAMEQMKDTTVGRHISRPSTRKEQRAGKEQTSSWNS